MRSAAAGLLLVVLAGPASAQNASICIDPGHGGSDPGAVGNGINEKDVNLAACLAFRDWLELDNADGGGGGSWDVHMTRDSDVDVSLGARADYANSLGVDYFMAIHANAGGGNGTETYAYASGTEADQLAHKVQEEVLDHLGTYDRGVKYADFYVLIYTAMPADLNEMAFLDVWEGNAELLSDPDNLDQVGLGHLHAIQRHVGLSDYTPDDGPPPDEDPTGTVTISDYPAAVEPGVTFDVTVAYTTDLHAHDELGQLVVQLKDESTWEVLDEQIWDAEDAGVQGPSGDQAFAFTAPDDVDRVFFVAYLTPLGAGWDERLDADSTLADPTDVLGGESVEGFSVILLDVPTKIRPGTEFVIEVEFAADDAAAETATYLMVEMVEASTGLIVEAEEFEPTEGILPTEGARSFTMDYDGLETSVWFHAFLGEEKGGALLAEDDTEADPTEVIQDGQGCQGCEHDRGGSVGVGALILLGLGSALIRRRR